jgi:hypothetical protein
LINSNNIFLSPLSIQQQDALSLLRNSIRDIENYDKWKDLSTDEINRIMKEDKKYKQVRDQLIKDIKRAIRLELIWHPLVYEFLDTHKSLGNKELIREIKNVWEIDVKRPHKYKNIKFISNIHIIERWRNEGKIWKEIRRELMKRKIIGNITLEAFRKKIMKFAPHLLPVKEFVVTEEMLPLITDSIQNKIKEL